MKRMKKLASILLALVMALALAVPAFAAVEDEPEVPEVPQDATITINNGSVGHTYTAYQIFKGDLATNADGKKVLANIEWGDNIDPETVGTALDKIEGLSSGMTAADVADYLVNGYDNISTGLGETEVAQKKTVSAAEFANEIGKVVVGNGTTSAAVTTENTTATINLNEYGYYLVKDNAPDGNTKDDVSAFMLQVVGPAEVKAKVPAPDSDKTIKKVDETNEDDHAAIRNVGDVIDYQLKATLPGGLEAYETYKLTFVDKMGAGLDLVIPEGKELKDAVTVKIKIGEKETVVSTDAYSVTYVEVTDKEATDEEATDEEEKVTGHTLQIVITDVKTLGENVNNAVITVDYQALLNENAEFRNENTLTLKYPRDPSNTQGGDPDKPDENETPEKTTVVFTFKSVLNKTDENENPLAGAMFKLEKKADDGNWAEIDRLTLNGAKTTFSFNGLGTGMYKLTETETPAGYNTINPVYFMIEATAVDTTIDEGGKLTKLDVYQCDEDGKKLGSGDTIVLKFAVDEADKTDGTAETDVVNRSGAVLPETGGIGTTIFYVVGGLLTVGAVVLLVTKKRMSSEK